MFRIFTSFAVAALSAWALAPAGLAQDAAPAFQPAPLFTKGQITQRTLPNGVRGVSKYTPNTDLVSIQVWVRAGSRYEQVPENGIATLVEIAALRSTRNFPAAEDDSGGPPGALEAVGGQAGSMTARDATFYSAVVAANYSELAMRVLADVTLRPDLANTAIEESKLVLQNSILRRSLDGVAAAMDLAYAKAYAKHPYRRPSGGTLSSLAGLTTTRAQAFHKRTYVGGNISVVVVGDIPPARAQQLIAQYFGPASAVRPSQISVAAESPPKLQVTSRRARVVREGLVLAWRSPPVRAASDVVALDTLLALWREGLDATLRKALLRDGEKGPNTPLVASYDVDFLTQKDNGIFAITLADPQDKAAAVNAVLAEVKRIQDNGVSAQELSHAKRQLRLQYIEQGESVSGQAGALGFYEMIDSFQFAVDYLAMCDKVTAEDLQRVAKKYLSTENYIRTEVAPLPPARPEGSGGAETITASWSPRTATGVGAGAFAGGLK